MDDNILKSLQEQIAQAQQIAEEARFALAPLMGEEQMLNAAEHQAREAFKAQQELFAKQRAEILKKQEESKTAKFQATVKINQLQHQINHIKAQEEAALKAAKEAEHEKNQYLALEKRFDQATIGAPWREWAKDHQISAGHKLAQDRYVILADPMGLGKTLSSIITAEMAEKATKDVTPEFPFLGQSEEVFVAEHFVWTDKARHAAILEEWPFTQKWFENVRIKMEDGNSIPVWRGIDIVEGNTAVGLPAYDIKNVMEREGIIRKVEAHYEIKVTNAITRPVGRKILYFCPAPLLRNVMEEWNNWAPHRSVTYIGAMSKAERKFALSFLGDLQEYVIICNYEAWRRDQAMLDTLIECKFDTVIIDEAHNIKEMSSVAYKGVEKVITGLQPEYIIPMTGTPILNRPQELFPLLHLINPKEFTHERDYLWAYCEQYETDDGQLRWKFKPGGLDVLAKKISKNYLRRTKDQAGIQLPEKSVIYHELDLDSERYPMQAKARKHMKDYATLVIDASKGKALQATVMIALITRLRQIETWPCGIIQYAKVTDPITGASIVARDPVTNEKIIELELGDEYAESQKIDYIIRKEGSDYEGLIPDVIDDERVVVFSQFKAPLSELKRRIEASGKTAVILDGSTPQSLRDQIRHDFDRKVTPNRADSKWDVLLANYKAAGVGLNLTNATQLITLDEEWNPGKRDQAWDRIHRIGQTENVTINVVRTKDTIDTWLAGIIDQKDSVVGGFDTAMINVANLKDAIDSGLI